MSSFSERFKQRYQTHLQQKNHCPICQHRGPYSLVSETKQEVIFPERGESPTVEVTIQWYRCSCGTLFVDDVLRTRNVGHIHLKRQIWLTEHCYL